MGSIMVRMGVVIGTLLVVQAGLYRVGIMNHPAVVEPPRPIDGVDEQGNEVGGGFPMEVRTPGGTWKGQVAKLDDRVFLESEVHKDVSRIFAKDTHVLKFFLAEYTEPGRGLYHNPMNCYRSNGFTEVGSTEMQSLNVRNRPDTKISVTTWHGTSENVIVAYWYEVGDRTLYERNDLWATQWAMFGKTKWPVMFKVLLEMPAGDTEQSRSETKAELLEMAQYVREWLGDNQPVVN